MNHSTVADVQVKPAARSTMSGFLTVEPPATKPFTIKTNNMKFTSQNSTFPLVTLSALLLLASFGCKKNDDNGCQQFNDNRLSITSQDESTTLPGMVSIFFKVKDNAGKPVAQLDASNFTIYEKGRNDDCPKLISSTESKSRISPKSQVFKYNTMLVLDFSGSVITNSLSELKSAAKSFVENVMPAAQDDAYRMGIWWFDGENALHPLIGFTANKAALNNAIDGISSSISTDPSTDLYGAIIKSTGLAKQALDSIVNQGIIGAGSIVVFTDGTDQAARFTKTEAFEKVKTLDQRIAIFSIGLGAEIDQAVLKTIGKSGNIFASNKTELESKFVGIANLVWAEANSYYLFEYCSPKRDGSGMNELIIEVTYSGKKGSLKTAFDATGFASGCQ